MKVAIVHDWFLQYGGAERVVEVLHEIWPKAPVYTAFVSRKFLRLHQTCHPDPPLAEKDPLGIEGGSSPRLRLAAGQDQNNAEPFEIHCSFLQRAPFISRVPRLYATLYPLVFESFDFSGYDVIISSDAFFAKRVITKPGTVHICLSEVVPHFLYHYLDLGKKQWFSNLLLAPLMNYLRVGDYIAAQRVDYFVANSKTTAKRIWKYYRKEVEVIYLPVDTKLFSEVRDRRLEIRSRPPIPPPRRCLQTSPPRCSSAGGGVGNYFMTVSRLTKDKRTDLAVTVCTQLNLPLKVVGEGEEKRRLQKLAGPTVEFLGWKNHHEQAELYQNCRALIFLGEEDFGIVPVEAMAAGVPVIAYGRGGATETVVAGQTGEFFSPQTPEALAEVLKNFDPSTYSPEVCRKQAEKFGKDVFKTKFKRFVEKCYKKDVG